MTDRENLARQWAEAVKDFPNAEYSVEAKAAIEHILATTTPPTMEGAEWDHKEHYLAGVDYDNGDKAVMIESNSPKTVAVLDPELKTLYYLGKEELTPNGKRYELREVGDDEPDVRRAKAIVEDLAHDFNLHSLSDSKLGRSMNEVLDALDGAKPDHPEVLETLEDYQNAPVGTVVTRATGGGVHMKFGADDWRYVGLSGSDTDFDMAGSLRRVLRWRGGEA